MKRFHVNVAVADLEQSVRFYDTLFGEAPTVLRHDYAKWMLDDPRINFSIAQSPNSQGVSHVGLQVESQAELEQIQSRLDLAGEKTVQQPDAECCYARSSKTWARDPDDVAWETFLTHGEITHYGSDHAPRDATAADAAGAEAGAAAGESRCCS